MHPRSITTVVRKPFRYLTQRWTSNENSSHQTAVYTWGIGTEGQLGHAKFEIAPGVLGDSYIQQEPRRLLKSKAYVQIACGKTFTLGVTATGSLYGWGEGFQGAESKSREPQLIPMTKIVSKVSAGSKHAAVIDVDGMVYTWGYGGSWLKGGGQLGHNSIDSLAVPKLVQAFKEYGARAASVSCGSQHTLILTDDGEVLGCGVGEYGRLGTGKNSDAMVPVPLEGLIDEHVTQVVAGQHHSLVLTASGKVFSWGRNDTGALGHTDSYIDIYSMEEYPRWIDSKAFGENDPVVFVAAGRGTSAAVTSSGQLLMWGRHFGHEPTKVEGAAFDGLKVRKVALGGDPGRTVTAVLTEDGGLWTFGDSSSKMLGLNNVSGKRPTPVRLPISVGQRVVDVFCGPGQHMAAIVDVPIKH